ncbi:MAG: glycosyltransferase family 2 protein [Planctomycetota bacterium]
MPQNGPSPSLLEPHTDVIVPLYREGEGVSRLLDSLYQVLPALPRPRLYLVDDGSDDTTVELAEAGIRDMSIPSVLLRHRRNLGLTEALATGFRAGQGDIVCWLDSDLSYAAETLVALVRAVMDGADLALASPYHPGGRVEGVRAQRLWLSRGLSRAYRLLRRSDVHTYSSMVRAWRRPLLARCLPERAGHLGVTESLLRAQARGARIVEVPALLRGRQTGRSGLRVLPALFRHLHLLRDSVCGRI